MKVDRFGSVQLAVQAVKNGLVDIGFVVELLHDEPPGDWYIVTHVLAMARMAEKLDRFFAGRVVSVYFRNGGVRYEETFTTAFMGGPLEMKPAKQIEEERAALAQPLEERAQLLGRCLSAL